jgi:polar amino acid transport system substrate-binding protein
MKESNDMAMTLKTGTLSVATAFPNPPWDVYNSKTGETGGFDIELISAISEQMNLTLNKIQYKGENFNNIFDGLSNRSYDVVISGTTITPERSQIALFSKPYLEFSQTIAVNRQKAPKVSGLPIFKVWWPAFKEATRRITWQKDCWSEVFCRTSNIIRIIKLMR